MAESVLRMRLSAGQFMVFLLAFFFVTNPSVRSEPEKKSGHFYFEKKKHKKVAHWSYNGDTGPEHWGELDRSYLLAKTGQKQSPVNIETKRLKRGKLPALILRYRGSKPEFINNGHTLQHDQGGDSSEMEVDGKIYRLEQYHLHSPSEHTIDGRHFPLELHLVHKSKEGQVAVIAVLFEEGSKSDALKLAAGVHLPAKEGEKVTARKSFNLRALLPEKIHYYEYSGSFTTPPCTEEVRWFVLKHHLEASASFLQELAGALDTNNRPVQKLNGRAISGD